MAHTALFHPERVDALITMSVPHLGRGPRKNFRGGINRYRNMDRDWHELAVLDEMKIRQPSLFLAGEHDSVLRYAVGMNLMDAMDPYYTDLRGKLVIPGAGHWVQQERPEEVNQAVLDFLRSLRSSTSGNTRNDRVRG